MLPPIESDELLIAQGIYQQLREGHPTDVYEQWALYALPDDARIWRSQLVYESRLISACYLLRDPENIPVQMVFFWQWPDGRDDIIEYRFAGRFATIIYQGAQHDMIVPPEYEIYGWHTVTENFIYTGYHSYRGQKQAYTILKPGIERQTLWPSASSLEATLLQTQIVPGQNGPGKSYVFSIEEKDVGTQTLYIDEFGIPTRWELPEQALAVVLADYRRAEF